MIYFISLIVSFCLNPTAKIMCFIFNMSKLLIFIIKNRNKIDIYHVFK